MLRRAALLAVLLLAGCGDLPRPFQGAPGLEALRLARPPAARLAVPTPTGAMLTEAAAEQFAGEIAEALERLEVPAVATRPRSSDWRLEITTEIVDANVVPRYAVLDPSGAPQGTVQGRPVPAAKWSAAEPATLQAASAAAAPGVSSLLSRIEAARKASDPSALAGRGPPKVVLLSVRGAPSDGDVQLARQIRDFLGKRGIVLQDSAPGADWRIEGRVEVVRTSPATDRVEIQWIVSDKDGEERGRVVQLNEIPAGTLDRAWGDVAFVVADEASGGVKDLIDRQSR